MADHGVVCSMSRSGNVWDNASDGELLLVAQDRANSVQNVSDAGRGESCIFDYIERFYNAKRRRSTIGYLSPMEFETKAGLA